MCIRCHCTFSNMIISHPLKVGGNEKRWGSGRSQMLGNGLGPWRSRFMYNLNTQLLNKYHISFSALSSKMNRRFVWQKALRTKQDLPTYNVPIFLRTEGSERKKWRGPNKKKIREVKSGSKFALRIWSASPFAGRTGPSYTHSLLCLYKNSLLF
jgi:hypothetical protein